MNDRLHEQASTVRIGDRMVHRMGFGAMRLSDPPFWAPPADRDNAIRVARRAVELGVDHLDTADSYAFGATEEILRAALSPYPDHLLIGTKAGQAQVRPGEWVPVGRPAYLRQQCEASLRRLGVEQIGLYYLHRVDPTVPFADQLGTMKELQEEGKIAHFGLSGVTVEQLETARTVIDVAAVQNIFNVAIRIGADVLEYCEREQIAFVAWFPILSGELAAPGSSPLGLGTEGHPGTVVAEVAAELNATPAQVALAWLLGRSPALCPIPGTASVAHLEQNVAAASLRLPAEALARLDAIQLPADALTAIAGAGSAQE